MPYLFVEKGKDKGASFEILKEKALKEGGISLGRHFQMDIVLNDMAVSRDHARIVYKDNDYYIIDNNSKHGILINDKKVNKESVLKPDDIIRIGNSVLHFFMDGDSQKVQYEISMDDITKQITIAKTHSGAFNKKKSIAENRLSIIYEISKTIDSILDYERLLEEIMDIVFETMQPERGMIALLDLENKNGKIVKKITRGPNGEKGIEIEISKTICDTVINKGTGLVTYDAIADRLLNDAYSIVANKVRSAICVPIRNMQEIVGLLYIDSRTLPGQFTKEDLEFLSAIGYLAGVAIQNSIAHKTIRNINQILEIKVEERTKELIELNKLKTTLIEKLKKSNEDLKQAYLILQKTQAQLVHSEKMASLGQLVAGITHELNNPLSFVQGNLVTLQEYIRDFSSVLEAYSNIAISEEDLQKISEIKEKVGFDFIFNDLNPLMNGIIEGVTRVKDIVTNLKTFSQLDKAKIKLTDIREGLNSTLNLLIPQYKNKIKVYKEYGETPPIECYAGNLNQVFMNIILNALQAMDEVGGGELWVKTYMDENENLVISIKDTGPGIPPENIKKIFDPFFTTKEVGKGTGLGLSISYGIVEAHNGKITVSSEVGKGTTFYITLPQKLAVKLEGENLVNYKSENTFEKQPSI